MTIMQRKLIPSQLVTVLSGVTLIGLMYIGMTKDAYAVAQRVGDFELAVDAPWRMEPRTTVPKLCDPTLGDCSAASGYEYGAIPIQVSIHDADLPNSAGTAKLQQLIEVRQSGESIWSVLWDFVKEAVYTQINAIGTILDIVGIDTFDSDLPSQYPVTKLQNFVSLTIAEQRDGVYQVQRSYAINDAHEVERTIGFWRWSETQSSSESTAPPPQRPGYQLCRRWQGSNCSALVGLQQTSEWHSTFHYRPVFGAAPGRDVRLRLDLTVRATVDGRDRNKTYTQYVNVHLGEKPLPKFDNRWVYGDLHYHAQGTDNDGESAYSYRGVLQAMGAMGLDFAFATDHASNSKQIAAARPDFSRALIEPVFRGLRDLSPDRFAFYIDLLNGSDGANRQVLSYPRQVDMFGNLATPQLFLGAEVDVIPEFAPGDNTYYYNYGSACSDLPGIVKFLDQGIELNDLGDLLGGGYNPPESVCNGSQLLQTTNDGRQLVRDVQGPANGRIVSTGFYGRQHLLHLPTDPLREDAFIPSNTSKYGGATRRLGEILDLELAHRNKGFMFLAHPLARASGSEIGRLGPDIVPYSESQYRDVFASPHFLGLQTWNENGQLHSSINKGDAKDYRGEFIPVNDLDNWKHKTQKIDPYKFADSARAWDTMLLWGLDPNQTSTLDWLPAGEPRRVFMAGGSDAHGDFNFRREGYFTGTAAVTDTAIGTPRNLVFAGTPDGELLSASGGTGRPHSQGQIVQALRDGNFTVTDGPAIRIAYDSNRNGVIDDADVPMGGIASNSNQCSFPLIVEWKSTPEFGRLENIDLYVGVHADTHQTGMIYQAWRAPGGRDDIKPGDIGGSTTWYDEAQMQEYVRAPGHFYWFDPTEDTLAIDVAYYEGYAGQRIIGIDPEDFPVGKTRSQCNDTETMRMVSDTSGQAYSGMTAGIATVESRTVSNSTSGNLFGQNDSGIITDAAPVETRKVNRNTGINRIDGIFDLEPPIYDPPSCDIDYFFEEAIRPDRLYIRAVATNVLAPHTDHNCTNSAYSPKGEDRPKCIRRRAYSNPLWVTVKPDRYNLSCALSTDIHTNGQIAVDNTDTSPTGEDRVDGGLSFIPSGEMALDNTDTAPVSDNKYDGVLKTAPITVLPSKMNRTLFAR